MRRRILKALVREGVLTERQVEETLKLEEESGRSFDRIIREKGWVTEDRLLTVIHQKTFWPYERSLGAANVPAEFVAKVPVSLARQHNLVAIDVDADGVYKVATCEPFNYHSMDEVASVLEAEVQPVLSGRAEITSLLNRAYQGKQGEGGEILDDAALDEALVKLDDDEDGAEDLINDQDKGPVIRRVNKVIFDGYRMRASDIHFQPGEDKLLVRFRIDGILYDKDEVPKQYQDAVITRLKVMSKMDIAERRLPQDGRASCTVGDAEIDIRFNSVPTNYGERVVLRLLDKTAKVFNLEDIGLANEDYQLLSRLINYQHGIILVTGPTGSGKTTTLYASLSKINSSAINCITIEDPIEYHLSGVSQIQVSAKKGLTFDRGLRALLRQDPDVMMVGEIRDSETARIAIQAALTGHLVFSTLHTNDAPSSVTRLLDIGVEPYLVASSVIAVIAQRLVRVICRECRSEYEPPQEELDMLGIKREQLKDGLIYLGMGCERCIDTGYQGRTAIYEILPIGEEVRQEVINRSGASKIKEVAMSRGMRSLRMDGARKVVEGHSTIEEVLRVTQLDV
ncbi:MAG: Flp pilus assembly complex ATPase component TadA [Planctomycetota bacterium]|nr:Flp pilus assembly complex ATPase component TadA [Planctomycetota bacterium]